MYLLPVFLFFIGVSAMWMVSGRLYSMSMFSKLPADMRLPIWEKLFYYFIAVYPVLSYIGLKLSGDYMFKSVSLYDAPVRAQFIFYTITHLLLCLLSLIVVRFLIQRHKLNRVFAVTGSIAGGMYFTLSLVVWIIVS